MCFFLKNKVSLNKELTLSKGAFSGLHYFSSNQESDKKEREDADTGYIKQGVEDRQQTSERVSFCSIIRCNLVDSISTTSVPF